MQFIDFSKQFDIIEPLIRQGMDVVYKHKKFINGPEVKELERELKEFVGVKHVICCGNGTDALTIPLMAWQLKKDDAVFVPSFTFFASAEAISVAGGTPVFVDCEYASYNMDVLKLEESIIKTIQEGKLNPRGILGVDLFGLPADYIALQRIAAKYNLFLMEDGAQSFGAKIGDVRACNFGDVATTSFFPAKPLGCYGDGGAIFTNNDALAEQMRSIHVHGQGSDKYDNVRIGLNSRLDTMQAVVLLAKLTVFNEELEMREAVAMEYTKRLSGLVETPVINSGFQSAWAQYTIKVPADKRSGIIEKLKTSEIPAMVYYPVPIHQSTAYKRLQTTATDLSVTEKLCSVVMSLPMHPHLSLEEITFVCDRIEGYLK